MKIKHIFLFLLSSLVLSTCLVHVQDSPGQTHDFQQTDEGNQTTSELHEKDSSISMDDFVPDKEATARPSSPETKTILVRPQIASPPLSTGRKGKGKKTTAGTTTLAAILAIAGVAAAVGGKRREGISERRFSFYHVPILSFFSKALYRDVGLYWKGTGGFFLFLLLAVCWIPTMANMHVSLGNFIKTEAPQIIEQVPPIRILNGELSVDAPQPYTIRDPETGTPLIVIDTTGAVSSLEETEAKMLITAKGATFQKSDYEMRSFEFSSIEDFSLDQSKIIKWLDALGRLFIPAIYLFFLVGSFLCRLILTLGYALVGRAFSSACGTKLSQAALMRLAIIAMTPCILVKTFLETLPFRLPYGPLWYFLVSLAYLFLGVKAASGIKQETSFQP